MRDIVDESDLNDLDNIKESCSKILSYMMEINKFLVDFDDLESLKELNQGRNLIRNIKNRILKTINENQNEDD